jgi:glycine/D-amino acid oxidase-like deaminating enzyme
MSNAAHQPDEFDFAVVGAGPLGSAATRHLTERQCRVALIGPGDVGDFTAHTGPWSGWSDETRMLHAVDVPLLSGVLAKRSRRRFAELQAKTGISFTTAQPALTVAPTAELLTGLMAGAAESTSDAAYDDPGTDAYFDIGSFHRTALDLDVPAEPLDEAALAARFPDLTLAPGHEGLYQPDSLLINPRRFVAAQQSAAAAAGATRIVDHVVSLTPRSGGYELVTAGGRRIHASRVVLAAGAYLNLAGLAPRPLAFHTFGATVTLARVTPSAVDFPTLMYLKATESAPFGGLIVPPVRYPDGSWYIKGVGDSMVGAPLHDTAEAQAWVRTGGDPKDPERFRAVLDELLPHLEVGDISTRPCLITINDTGFPYIGLVDDGLVVATDGDHGVTLADEIARLAAGLATDGTWRDTLPAEQFTPKYR